MSNVEHAFENCLFHFMRTGEYPNVKKNDSINAAGMSEDEINTVEVCATYLCFGHTSAQMYAILYPERYIG